MRDQHHVGERGFACARGACKRQPFPVIELEIYATQNPAPATLTQRVFDANVRQLEFLPFQWRVSGGRCNRVTLKLLEGLHMGNPG